MDASVTPLRHGGLSLVQTTDFFYPLVDDPYMMVSQLLLLAMSTASLYWPSQLLLLATSTASTGRFYWPHQLLLLATSTASTGCFYWPRNFLNLSSDTQIISPMYISSFNYVLRLTNSNFKTYTNKKKLKFI